VRVAAEVLEAFAARLLAAAGVPAAAAAGCAAVLVEADLEDNGSHGLLRLPIYLAAIARGQIDPAATPRVETTGPATAVVDGANTLGPVVARAAMDEAIRLARAAGVGMVTARHSNHYGPASYYAAQAAAAGMIGLTTTNSPPAMPPWGGRAPYLGTNPIACAFPGSGAPLVVDLSLSVVARGKIIQAARQGQPIPPGWAVDAAGRETTDPRAVLAGGAVLPLGGAKGFALALAVEVLSGLLAGAAFGPHVTSILADDVAPANVGHWFLAADVARFLPPAAFGAALDQLRAELKAAEAADPRAPVRLPGERRAAARAEQRAHGVALPPETLRALDDWAARLGQPPLAADQMEA